MTDLLNLNLTSLVKGLNLTSLLAGLNLTNIIGNKTPADSGNTNTGSNWWDNIFGKKDSNSGSILDNIINWITGNNKNNSNSNNSQNAAPAKATKKATKITAKKKTFKAKKKVKKYTITLKSGKTALKKVKVTIKIGKKTYKAKTNSKGVATFKINKLFKKGKYTAVIKFAGNSNYKSTTKKVKITVK